MRYIEEKNIHRVFEISVLLKGLHALLELVGGMLLYVVSTSAITAIVTSLTQEELLGDPNDFVATYLLHSAQTLSVGSKTFAAFYLLSHGIVKIALVIGLLRNKYWAYPASLVVMGLFILYQVYRFSFTHSVGLVALTIFDAFLIWLIWHEYKLVRAHKPLQ